MGLPVPRVLRRAFEASARCCDFIIEFGKKGLCNCHEIFDTLARRLYSNWTSVVFAAIPSTSTLMSATPGKARATSKFN